MGELDGRVPVLYLAPWVDFGGADKGTIDWFRFLDRGRFAPSLITTQPSANRRLAEVAAYAEEIWDLPQLMRGNEFPQFICAFIISRGVKLVHIMNSRLGFELLPVMATLPERPRLVVQLHVDEPDGSGYVRYVTTRYGNLVDAYSVSSQALSERLSAYDVPLAKRRLIRTGVDAQREFDPARVKPIDGLDRERFQILFPARLTGQKNPLLMLEVAARLRARGLAFQIHVLGDGDLGAVVRERIADDGLEREVVIHEESLDVARWYAACDAVLLTSQFEGLPYVAYEAMAMELPLVAPGLPGLDELITPDTGLLVSPVEEAEPYAAAIAELADHPGRRAKVGEAARSRVLAHFSLERMAAEHADLYEELLRPRRPAHHEERPAIPQPAAPTKCGPSAPVIGVAFRNRRPGSSPLVSVVIPCFNHGRYLPDCVGSIQRQTYDRIETIIADDGSTDTQTLATLATLERDRTASVVHLPVNRGPGAARNAAIERAKGRFVLPLDADNMLLPTAISDLVDQLSNAGEQIGFVYPNLQFFGNRRDYFEAPSYNLHALLSFNYCDTGSLIDREVFDRGLQYSAQPGLNHEDWEFVLSLAEHGIYGEPARQKTLLFRKRGFTRSDLVELTANSGEAVASRHSRLFGAAPQVKAEWNPSVTVLALDPVQNVGAEAVSNLVWAAWRQTCADFELVIRTKDELWPTDLGRRLRRIPADLASSRAQALAQGVAISRGRYILATYASVAALLADPATIEKLLRLTDGDDKLAAIALAESEPGWSPFRLLDPDATKWPVLSALLWTTVGQDAPPATLPLPGNRPLEILASWFCFYTRMQWRHLKRRDSKSLTARPSGPGATVGTPRHPRALDARFRTAPAMLPACPPDVATTLGAPNAWRPPQTRPLCRHLHAPSGRYVYSNGLVPADGWTLAHVLGVVRALPLPGTTSLLTATDGTLAFGDEALLEDPSLLGFIEQAPLPLLDQLGIGRHPQTGQRLLIAGASDPLSGTLEDVTPVGYIEPYPVHPQHAPHVEVNYGVVGLVRTVDASVRRHRYRAGSMPPGAPAGELGALLREPIGECDPLWIDDQDRVFAARASLSNGRPTLGSALRWAGAPLTWSNFSRLGPKLRASARRAYDTTLLLASAGPAPTRPSEPAGYLLRAPTGRTVPLYGGIHPVTGDQLLSTSPSEASSLGYRDTVLLGHLVARAPVTGSLGPIRAPAPWAFRFGLVSVMS